jgi:hypothetical protein
VDCSDKLGGLDTVRIIASGNNKNEVYGEKKSSMSLNIKFDFHFRKCVYLYAYNTVSKKVQKPAFY